MSHIPVSATMHSGPGFRINTEIHRPSPDICAAFAGFTTADISDQLNRQYTLAHDIHNIVNEDCFSGPAVTVKVFPGDNLMLHKAVDIVQPGDVVVIDASGSTSNAVIGDLIASKLKHKGVVGVIVDGLARDLPDLKTVGLPIFAKGVSPIGPLHRGPGELNFSICCGGTVVSPGDIVVADNIGAVIVHQNFANDLLQTLQLTKNSRAEYEKSVRQGVFNNDWVETTLQNSRCAIQNAKQ